MESVRPPKRDWSSHYKKDGEQLICLSILFSTSVIKKSKSDPKSIACLTGFSALWNIHRHLKTTPFCRFVTFSVCTFYQHHQPVDGPGLIHPCKNKQMFVLIKCTLTGKQTQTSEMVSNVYTCSKGVEKQGGGRRKVNKCLKNSFNVEEHYF